MENIFHRFLASRLFICFLEVSFSESTKSSARSIQLFCLSTTAALPALATSWAHQDGLVQHWQPRSLILDGLCQNTDLYLIITMLIIIGICWLFWPRSNFAIAVLQVTNLGKTFLKKGRGISVLRFAQLWDCVSVLRFTQCLGIYSVFEIVSALIRYFLSFEIASVLILSQFW